MAKQFLNFYLIFVLMSLIVVSSDAKANYENVSFITDEEIKSAQLLDYYDTQKYGNDDLILNGSYFEGDILLPKKLKGRKNVEKYISRSMRRHWPNGRVPYYLDTGFSDTERERIAEAIAFFERNTCIRWVRKQDNEKDWVWFTRRQNGCFSMGIGKISGKNQVNLGTGCFTLATVIHEMMHRIGFIHEQSRPDRDQYIYIFHQNIQPDAISQFSKRPEYFNPDYKTKLPYDIHSVMHYREKYFSRNGQNTIMAKNGQPLRCAISGMKCPTDLDIQKINMVYNCKTNKSDQNVICSQLHWKNVVTIVPADNAIIGGFDFDGQPLYICRAKYRGRLIPGKAKPKGFGCAVTHERKERLTKKYELLVGPNAQKVNWVSNKVKPKNMFTASKINSREVYIGRCDVKKGNSKSRVIGRVENQKFYFTDNGKEYNICKIYEVLTCDQN